MTDTALPQEPTIEQTIEAMATGLESEGFEPRQIVDNVWAYLQSSGQTKLSRHLVEHLALESLKIGPPYRIVSLDQLIAYPPQPPKYLVDGWIAEDSLHIFFGPPSSMKSYTTLNLLLKLTKGEDWFGIPVSSPVNVAYVSLEDSRSMVFDRLSKLGLSNDGSAKRIQLVEALPREFISEISSISLELLACHTKVVVVDPAVRLLPAIGNGVANAESDSGTVANLLGLLRENFARRGCSVVILHHSVKSSDRKSKADWNAVRGSGDWIGACEIAASVSHRKSTVEIFCVRNKYGETSGPLKIEVASHGKSVSLQRVELPPVGPDISHTNCPSKIGDAIEAEILNHLRSGDARLRKEIVCCMQELYGQDKRSTIHRVIKRLIKEGRLFEMADGALSLP